MDRYLFYMYLEYLKDKDGANERTGKPLAPKTIRHNLSFISDVFSYAVRMDLVSDNPCRKVTIPKGEVKEKQIYSQEEMAHLLTAINGEPLKYKAFFFLIAYSGFRRSEMLGLEWKDIDFENNIITIKRTSNYTAERGIYTDTTKTKRSQRVLKISSYIMEILKEYKLEQAEEALRLGDKWVESDRLFVKWNGEPMNNQTPYGWFREFCKHNGFRFCDIHSLRHLHASLLINAGIDVVAVSGDMGHSVVGTMLNLYSHMFQEVQESATAMQSPKLSTSGHENSHSKSAVAYIKTKIQNKWLTSGWRYFRTKTKPTNTDI